jgi:hypothetical protein
MSFIFVMISILVASVAVAQAPPSAAQTEVPPPTARIDDVDVKESGCRAVVDFVPGKPIDAPLLNRSTDTGRHETYFISDPTKRSGVMVFCDDTLGTTIGVVATDLPKSNDLEAGWRQERRFWQEKAWCINVTSLGWSEDGRFLFVATSDTYGSGNVYQLNIEKRLAAVIFPVKRDATLEGHCWSTHIDAIGKDSITVHARDYCEEDKIFAPETLPFLTEEQFGGPLETTNPEEEKPGKSSAGDLNK